MSEADDEVLDAIEAPDADANDQFDWRRGHDPDLRDARTLTLQSGVRKLRHLFPFQKPVFREDGNIPSAIGRYRIARDQDGTSALLFAFDPDDLKETDLSKNSPPGRLERLHVVHARQNESPAHWAYPEIIRHQQQLQDRALTDYTLYQTGQNTWRGNKIGYVLYPVEEGTPSSKKAGDAQYNVWMFSDTQSEGDFTAVRFQPPQGMIDAGLTLGSKLGTMNREDAIKKIRGDFALRVRRAAEGRDPVSFGDKIRQPIWLLTRAWQKTRRYFSENKLPTILMDAGVMALSAIGGPISFAQSRLADAIGRIRESYKESTKPLEVTDNLARMKRKAKGFDAVLRDVDPKALAGFRLMRAREAGAAPIGEDVVDQVDTAFSQRRLLGAMVSLEGVTARIRQNGIVSLRHANGVKVDHAPPDPETGLQTSYIRFDPESVVENARPLRRREAALFEGDRIMKITGRNLADEDAKLTLLSGNQFRDAIRDLQHRHEATLKAEEEAVRKAQQRPSGPKQRWRNRLRADIGDILDGKVVQGPAKGILNIAPANDPAAAVTTDLRMPETFRKPG